MFLLTEATAKRCLAALCLLLMTALCCLPPARAALPGVPAPPQVPARSYVMMDFHSGELLAEHDADLRLEPASLTKIMTVYVAAREIAAGRIALEDTTVVSEKAWRTSGSRMFIEVDTTVSILDLFKGIIVQSGNDASVALAEHVSGTEEVFASLMNHYAAELGMSGTSFGNSTGLPHPETYSTARDQARLAAALIREFPDIYRWFSDKSFSYNDITQQNRNRLLTLDSSVDGIKTGHTEAAGYCLASSAERGGMRLVAVVMGASSDEKRTDASRTLLNYGFRFFETHKLYDAEETVAESRVWKGADDTLAVGFPAPLYVTIPRGYYEELDASVSLDAEIVAPVSRGETRGEVSLSFRGKPLRKVPLLALHDVAPGGIVGRTLDSIMLWFE